jgi:hypothetical protein
MFDEETIGRIVAAAAESRIDPARLLAVCEVESGGLATAEVNGRQEPLIRFEGHYFDRRLSPDKRQRARRLGLASPVAGAIANPPSQAARWALVAAAAAIDHDAAYESVSWGIGQVMGANWNELGYASVDDLVAEARGSVEGQVRLMLRFLARNGMVDMLAAGDWAGFAARYNGPGYRRNRYDAKLAAACAAYDTRLRASTGAAAIVSSPPPVSSHAVPATTAMPGMIEPGAHGEAVADLQRSLTALGHPVPADGAFGPATRAAVQGFQHASGLAPDGIAGPVTIAAIARTLPAAGPSAARMVTFLGLVRRLLSVLRWFLGR